MSNGYKIKQRWIYMAVVLITVISQFLYLPASFVAAATDSTSGTEIAASGLTSADALDESNQTLNSAEWTIWKTGVIHYTWKIDSDEKINSGDYVTLNLPDNMTFQENYTNVVLTTPDLKTVIGTFTGLKGSATGKIVFNDFFANRTEGRTGLINIPVVGTIDADAPTTGTGDGDLLISKAGWALDELNNQGHQTKAQWEISANTKPDTISNMVITDTIDTSNQSLSINSETSEPSFQVEYAKKDSVSSTSSETTPTEYVPASDYTITTSNNDATKTTTIIFTWKTTLTRSINIFYQTDITDQQYLESGVPTKLTNTATVQGTKTDGDGGSTEITADTGNGHATAAINLGVGGTGTGQTAKVDISGTKTWDDADNQDGIRPTTVTINLLANGSVVDSRKVNANDNWQYEFSQVDKNDSAGNQITYNVQEDGVSGYQPSINGYNITNIHQPKKITISGQKTWNDANNQDGKRPDQITVHLFADGTQVDTKTVTAADDWKYSFADQPVYHAGKEIKYTVTEDKVADYNSTVNGYDITNSYTPETTQVSGQKIWNDADNQDGKRPAQITVHLLADGQPVQSQTVTAQDNWQYSFTNLPMNKAGKAIAYTVAEDAVAGYTASTTKGSNDITNTHAPETTAITGTKTWQDNNDQAHQRPDAIIVNLVADGVTIASEKVTAKDNWQYSFDPVPVYQDGQKIVYTVTEDAVTNYQTEITGFDISNTYLPKTPDVPVTPTEPKQPQTITPQTPVLPTVPKTVKKVVTKHVQAKATPLATKQRILPQAGEATNQLTVVLGVFLIILGGCTLLRRVEWSN